MSSACDAAPDPKGGDGLVQRKLQPLSTNGDGKAPSATNEHAAPSAAKGRWVGVHGTTKRATEKDWQIFLIMAAFGGVLIIVMVSMLNPLRLSWLPAPPERPGMLYYGILFIFVALGASFLNEFCFTPVEELQEMEEIVAAPPFPPVRQVAILSETALDLRSRLQDLLDPVQAKTTGQAAHSYAEVQAAQRLVERLGEQSVVDRFLVARSNCPQAAEQMFRDTIRWRAKVVDKLYSDPRASKDWEEVEPYWMARGMCAREGRSGPTPVAYHRSAWLLPLFKKFGETQLSNAYVRWMEEQLEFQVQAAHQLRVSAPEVMTPKMVEIFDLGGVGWGHCRFVLGIRFLSRVLSVGQRYYPENLCRGFLLNVPKAFSLAWHILQKVLDKSTKEKIVITSEAWHPSLEDYVSLKELNALRSTLRPYDSNDSMLSGRVRIDPSQ